MKKMLRLTLAVVAGLALASGDAWAGKAVVLGDKDLASIWAGQLEIENEAENGGIATQGFDNRVTRVDVEVEKENEADRGGIANQGDGNRVTRSEVENENEADRGGIANQGSHNTVTRVEHENEAEEGSLANSGTITQNVSNSQNRANGQNLSNAMLSAVAQQNNVLSVRDASAEGRIAVTGGDAFVGIGVIQSNTATIRNFER